MGNGPSRVGALTFVGNNPVFGVLGEELISMEGLADDV
jgi:hypothetical protein